MITKFLNISAMMLLLLIIISCRQNNNTDNENIPSGTSNTPITMDDSSRVIIDRAIAYTGDYDAWQKMETFSFDEKSIFYDSNGKVKRESNTNLDYIMKPYFKGKHTYTLNDTVITLVYDGRKAAKFYNGKAFTTQKEIDVT